MRNPRVQKQILEKILNKKKLPTFEALPDYSTFKSWKDFGKKNIQSCMCTCVPPSHSAVMRNCVPYSLNILLQHFLVKIFSGCRSFGNKYKAIVQKLVPLRETESRAWLATISSSDWQPLEGSMKETSQLHLWCKC